MLCRGWSTTSNHSIWNFLNSKRRLLLSYTLSLVAWYPTVVRNLIRAWLLKWEESAGLWWGRRAIFLDDFNLMSWDNHFLAGCNDLLLLRVVVIGLSCSNPYLVSVSNITCLWNRLRRLLLWSLTRNECNIFQLNPLHNCSWRFTGMHSTNCAWVATRRSHLSFWWLTSTCTVELDHLLRYNLALVLTNHWWLLFVDWCGLDLCLGWVADLLDVILEYSLLIWDYPGRCVRLCRFNLISVWGCHSDTNSSVCNNRYISLYLFN